MMQFWEILGSSLLQQHGFKCRHNRSWKKTEKTFNETRKNLIIRRWHVSLNGLDVKCLTGNLKECLRVASYKIVP